ncbi:MAG: hypothetical protein WCI11_12315 [Candidatus Methylumidiphilus sp.]
MHKFILQGNRRPRPSTNVTRSAKIAKAMARLLKDRENGLARLDTDLQGVIGDLSLVLYGREGKDRFKAKRREMLASFRQYHAQGLPLAERLTAMMDGAR